MRVVVVWGWGVGGGGGARRRGAEEGGGGGGGRIRNEIGMSGMCVAYTSSASRFKQQ